MHLTLTPMHLTLTPMHLTLTPMHLTKKQVETVRLLLFKVPLFSWKQVTNAVKVTFYDDTNALRVE